MQDGSALTCERLSATAGPTLRFHEIKAIFAKPSSACWSTEKTPQLSREFRSKLRQHLHHLTHPGRGSAVAKSGGLPQFMGSKITFWASCS
jgi:hypothetical protein